MVLGVPIEDVIKKISHDGSAIVFEDARYPWAGFDVQEIIDVAVKYYGFAVTPIESCPQVTPDGTHIRDLWTDEEKIKERMQWYFDHFSGIVYGERFNGGNWHVVAWDHKGRMWHDPSGPITEKPPIKIATFYVFQKAERYLAKGLIDEILKRANERSG
jgi:hypothetical protein